MSFNFFLGSPYNVHARFKRFTRLSLEFEVLYIVDRTFQKFLQLLIAIAKAVDKKLVLNRFCAFCNFNLTVKPVTHARFKIYKAMF